MKTASLDGRFLLALCHDLRGPLGALGTWVHVLASGQADPVTQAQALASMARDIHAQGALLDQLSELAAVLDGTARATRTRIGFVPFVKAVIAERSGESTPVHLHAQEPGPTVLADPDRLRRLITLLTTSAVKLTPGDHLEVRVEHSGGMVELVLEAAGIPNLVSLALVRALVEVEDGTFVETVASGKTTLRLRLSQT